MFVRALSVFPRSGAWFFVLRHTPHANYIMDICIGTSNVNGLRDKGKRALLALSAEQHVVGVLE